MIHGRDDRTVPMEVTLRTAAVIPDVRAVILNRCGHWTQVEHTAEFNRLVLNFVGAKDAAPAQKTGFGG
jgi:2-hydroxy-6-oxonona-2,4-dienedioate hydrolase